jgi:hypothetical protein
MTRAAGHLARNQYVFSMRIGVCAMKIHHSTKALAWRIFFTLFRPRVLRLASGAPGAIDRHPLSRIGNLVQPAVHRLGLKAGIFRFHKNLITYNPIHQQPQFNFNPTHQQPIQLRPNSPTTQLTNNSSHQQLN